MHTSEQLNITNTETRLLYDIRELLIRIDSKLPDMNYKPMQEAEKPKKKSVKKEG